MMVDTESDFQALQASARQVPQIPHISNSVALNTD